MDTYDKEQPITKQQCLYVFENELSNWAILESYGIELPEDALTGENGFKFNVTSIQ